MASDEQHSSSTPTHTRRVHAIARHLVPPMEGAPPPGACITTASCSSNDATATHVKPTYASVTGQPSSYARVHGQVSTAPVQWRRIERIGQHTLEEVLYDKGEGMAKVSGTLRCTNNTIWSTDHHQPAAQAQRIHAADRYVARCGGYPHRQPYAVDEMSKCFADARQDPAVGVVILTGAGDLAFCSGGDQSVRGQVGRLCFACVSTTLVFNATTRAAMWVRTGCLGSTCSTCRCKSADCPSPWWPWWLGMQWAAVTFCTWCATSRYACWLMRLWKIHTACVLVGWLMSHTERLMHMWKIHTACVWLVGDRHTLRSLLNHDAPAIYAPPHTTPPQLQIAADNAVFGQTGPKVGSFDAGYGSTHMARLVGQKKAREIWFLCRLYDAQQALQMGLVNTVVPLRSLERETVVWCDDGDLQVWFTTHDAKSGVVRSCATAQLRCGFSRRR